MVNESRNAVLWKLRRPGKSMAPGGMKATPGETFKAAKRFLEISTNSKLVEF